MAKTIILRSGDPALGKLDKDDAIAEWPTVDLSGNPIPRDMRPFMSLRILPNGYFVALRANQDDPDLTIEVGAASSGQG